MNSARLNSSFSLFLFEVRRKYKTSSGMCPIIQSGIGSAQGFIASWPAILTLLVLRFFMK